MICHGIGNTSKRTCSFFVKIFRNMSEYVLTYADICYIIKTVKGDT